MISAIISRLVILVFGTLYPAYASYKAVRTKNLKEYVKWMMYWIVFALFTCTETFTDVFLSWFPFYYEVKIVLVLWLLSPATKGSSILYRKFVHPALCRREQEIDEYIAKAKDQGYHTVLNLGTKGVNYATTVIMQTAIKGGGGLVQQIRKSYSLSDLSECEPQERSDETDDVITEPRLLRRNVKTGYRRSTSESHSRSPLYFPEVDVDVRAAKNRTDEPDFSHIKSSEDISSGYSSADNSGSLTRAGSIGAARARSSIRSTRTTTVTTIKRPQAAEENEVIIEELRDDDSFDYANMPPLINLPPNLHLSHTSPPFIYQYVGEEVKIIKLLGDYPLSSNCNIQPNNSDQRDQKEAITKDVPPESDSVDKEFKVDEINNNPPTNTQYIDHTNILTRIHDDQNYDDKELEVDSENTDNTIQKRDTERESKDDFSIINIDNHDFKNKNERRTSENNENVKESDLESTSIDASVYDNESAESDDEASFGTPDDSPKVKRKSPKGKYGKLKAPPPPPTTSTTTTVDKGDNNKDKNIDEKPAESDVITTEKETLNEIISKLPDTNFKESGNKKGLNVVNPIFEKKRRHKSKSPNRHPKGSPSGIAKLLQIPGKLAFWHKSDDKIKDSSSISSGSESRRSSTNEKTIEEIQNSTTLDNLSSIVNISDSKEVREIADDQISFKDAAEYIDVENEAISHDIIEKSDALQKLIEAKLESHPEYKIVTLHEELPTSSKTTDV